MTRGLAGLSLILLTIPACQCIEREWPWSACRHGTKAEQIPQMEAPPEIRIQSEAVDPPSQFAEAAEPTAPEVLHLPTPEPPPLGRDARPTAISEKKDLPFDNSTRAPEPHVLGQMAPTDPTPLRRPQAMEPHPLLSALQFYLDGRPDEAVKFLGLYDAKDQEVLLSLLPLIAQVGRGGLWLERLSPDEALVVLHQMSGLCRDLQKRAPLGIDRAVFCRTWEGYGQPVRVPNPTFRPGDRVSVYVEVQNLVDRLIKTDEYAVRLSAMIEVRGGDGQTVWTKQVDGPPSVSQAPRHDHFTVVNFSIPRTLPPGSYTLQIGITDEDTRRHACHTVPFQVAAPVAANALP